MWIVYHMLHSIGTNYLFRKHWMSLNRLRTGVGRYRSSMKKWGLADSAACECGEPEQTAAHIINRCPLYIDHHPQLASVKLDHWQDHGYNTLSWQHDLMICERRRRLFPTTICYGRLQGLLTNSCIWRRENWTLTETVSDELKTGLADGL